MTNKLGTNPVFRADWVVILIYICMLVFGWLSICGASYEIGQTDLLSWDTRTGKQLVWMVCASILALFLLLLDDRYFEIVAKALYWFFIILLFITPFIAKDIKGSKSWLSLGVVNLQPAEFAKCATALAVAKLFSTYGFTMAHRKDMIKAIGTIMLPLVLIVMQKETGSALVFFAFFLMLYREGLSGSLLFTAVAMIFYFVVSIRFGSDVMPSTLTSVGEFVALLSIWLFSLGMIRVYLPRTPHALRLLLWGGAILFLSMLFSHFVVPFDVSWALLGISIFVVGYLLWHAIELRMAKYLYISLFTLGSTLFLYSTDYALNNILQPHQQTRIRVLLGVEENNSGAGYNVNQSLIAIGSGGLTGKGFLEGTQTKLKYVPEQDTDFIFCTVGEEEGFVGSTIVLLLFFTLICRLIYLAERQSTTFGRVYGYCVLSIFFFHVLVNVGMVIGLMPVIGIPLPFFSYGGSSLWGFTLLLFIFLRIDVGNKLRERF
ncbi:MAG: rod shape-determining protein RodA [Bacteroidaceae bacterium]|nr:rod shape-determining protein RodA [Bacteroidaceae bacterium]